FPFVIRNGSANSRALLISFFVFIGLMGEKSKLVGHAEDKSRLTRPRTEPVNSKIDTAVGEADERPTAHFKIAAKCFRPIDNKAELERVIWSPPAQRLYTQFRPAIEKIISLLCRVEKIFANGFELKRVVGSGDCISKRDAGDVAKDTADHRRGFQVEFIFFELENMLEIVAQPNGTGFQRFVIITRFNMKMVIIGIQ